MTRRGKPFSAAVVGTGFIGPVHVEGLRRAGVYVAGIVGSSPDKSQAAAEQLGLPRGYATLDEALADPEIDSVHLATPNRMHFAQAAAVLRAGKHVLCEKPLAMTSVETAELVRIAADSGLAAGVAYNIRFYPLCHEAAARAASVPHFRRRSPRSAAVRGRAPQCARRAVGGGRRVSEWFAGIDLGGTSIGAAAATRDGRTLAEETVPTHSHEGPIAVLQRIGDLIERLSARCVAPPMSIGVGVPGLVDLASGATKFLPNLPTQWRDVPVRATLQGRFSVPVGVLNDCRTATLGELLFGHGRTVRTFALFALGTGVGGGVVIDGRLRLGPLGAAGELGHQTIVPGGPLCGCGNRGCLEAVASGPAITAEGVRLLLSGQAPGLHTLVDGDVNRVSPRTIADAATAGDAGSRSIVERTAEYLAVAAANIVTALHPELIVVAGGVAEMGELLLAPVRRGIRERVRMFPADDVRVEKSQLGDDAGVRGAVALAIQTLEAA